LAGERKGNGGGVEGWQRGNRKAVTSGGENGDLRLEKWQRANARVAEGISKDGGGGNKKWRPAEGKNGDL